MTETERINSLFYIVYYYTHIYETHDIIFETTKSNSLMLLTFVVRQMGLYDEWCEYEERRRSDEQDIPGKI